MKGPLRFHRDSETIVLDLTPAGRGWRVRLPDGSDRLITPRRLAGDIVEVTEIDAETGGQRVFRIPFARTDQGLSISYGGDAFLFTEVGAPPIAAQTSDADADAQEPERS